MLIKLTERPTAPEHLTAIEVLAFDRLAEIAMDDGGPGLTKADLFILEMAAIDYGKWFLANQAVNDSDELAGGLVVENEVPDGIQIKASPYAAEMHKFQNDFVKRLLDLRLIRVAESKRSATPSSSERPIEDSDKSPSGETKPLAGLRIHG